MDEVFVPRASPGILHHYSEGLCAFEYGDSDPKYKPHSLLFIAGLSDGLGTVPFINDLVKALEPTNWSVFSVLLSSSYGGWGLGSLDKDVEEIARCVEYVRAYKAAQCQDTDGKITLMGHSTGSQDVLHYLYSSNPLQAKRLQVDGAILQAPVSDRENLLNCLRSSDVMTKEYNELVDLAKKNIASGGKNITLPLASTSSIGFPSDVPISSHRFLSLASPDSPESPLEDDLFSSDLSDERLQRTFGAIGSRGILKNSLLVLPSGADEFVPSWVNKEKLLERWEQATKQVVGSRDIWDVNSGIVTGAQHSPSGPDQENPRKELVYKVEKYLNNLV
ncbi:hypothetical protein PRK78_000516 [Emydomyces testavorans]|uniref:Esterase n=1 Tax=Emydomyces testavorans TaxID=2070801 RepID=A0AAF0DB78_9EURO|nr:hypothetical protein PRK78_000516 [Emydomyces testavorans]